MQQIVCVAVVLGVLAGAAPVSAAQGSRRESCTVDMDVPDSVSKDVRLSAAPTLERWCGDGAFTKVTLQVPVDSSDLYLRVQVSPQAWRSGWSTHEQRIVWSRQVVRHFNYYATLLIMDPDGTPVGACSGGRAMAIHCTSEGGYVSPLPASVSRATVAVPTPRMGDTRGVTAHCEKEWPTDFRMQAYCQRQALAAAQELNARTMDTPDRRTIRTQCLSEWSADVRMVNYCEQRQLDALRQLGRER
jgi:hypothetical protein